MRNRKSKQEGNELQKLLYSPFVFQINFLCVSQKLFISGIYKASWILYVISFLKMRTLGQRSESLRRIGSAVFGGLVQFLTYLQVSNYRNFWNTKRW